ncbi:MAG: hypothetical protein AB7K41_02425 [Bdellovibrionales bacterium]
MRAFFLFLSLLLGWAQLALGQNGPVSPTLESLRLTHTIYAGLLEAYKSEGQSDYHPEFLAYRAYFKTFLADWNQALESGQVRNSRHYWQSVKTRDTYLGRFYSVWQRIHPYDAGATGQMINLGHYRNSFLTQVVNSETQKNYEQRLELILNWADQFLIQTNTDVELGIRIVSAFRFHKDPHIREQSRRIIASSPRFAKIASGLILLRDLTLLWQAGLKSITLPPKMTAGISSHAHQFKGPLDKLRALWPRELFGKIPTIWKAGATSVAAHGAIIATPKSTPSPIKIEVDHTDYPHVFLLTALRANLFQVETADNDLVDFKPQTFAFKLDRWRQKGVAVIKNPKTDLDWSQFFLEGELLLNFWQGSRELTAATSLQALQNSQKHFSAIPPGAIETFRENLLTHILKDYRGKRRTLTGLFLDWGGNCVSQTLATISYLKKYPGLIPAGYQLGVAHVPNHMEAVLMNDQEIWFLMSGKKWLNDQSITVLRPESLIARALGATGANTPISLADFYLAGKPDHIQQQKVPANTHMLLEKVDNSFSESGLAGGLGRLFAFKHIHKFPSSTPDWAEMRYARSSDEIRKASAEQNGNLDLGFTFSSLLKTKKTDEPGIRYLVRDVTMAGTKIKLCLIENSEFPPVRYSELPCLYTGKRNKTELITKLINISSNSSWWTHSTDVFNSVFISVPPSSFDRLMAMPPELWLLMSLHDGLDEVKTKLLPEVSDAAVARIQSGRPVAQDAKIVEALAHPVFNPSGEVLDASINWLYMFPDELHKLLLTLWPSGQMASSKKTRDCYNYKLCAPSAWQHNYEYLEQITRSSVSKLEPWTSSKSFAQLKNFSLFLQQIQTYTSRHEALPEFFRMYPHWPHPFRWTFVKIWRKLFLGSSSLFYVAQMREFLNSLDPNKIQIADIKSLNPGQQASCVPRSINLPIRTNTPSVHTLGPIVNHLLTCDEVDLHKQGTDPSSLNMNDSKMLGQSNPEVLDPLILAELSLAFSGGVHLWNNLVFERVKTFAPMWAQAGIAPVSSVQADPIDAIFPHYARETVRRYNWTAIYRQAAEAVYEVLPRAINYRPVPTNPRPPQHQADTYCD